MSAPTTSDTRAVDPTLFRSVLGNFRSGITAVTALGPEGPLVLICQSFTSLLLDPPLVLLSPSKTSKTWPRIREIGSFCINILAEHHQEISNQMARSGTDKFAGAEWDTTQLRAPRLTGSAAWLDCTLEAEHDGGDHTIVVAAVHDLSAAAEVRPLLYYQSRYTSLAHV